VRAVVLVAGSRPEIIKLAPVMWSLRESFTGIDSRFVLTGQHADTARALAAELLLHVDDDLGISAKTPGAFLGRAVDSLSEVFATTRPSLVVVQGDTASTLAGALAGFYAGIPVAHIEAGLRSGRLDAPFPEEANRRLISTLASLHFAPTKSAVRALEGEGVQSDSIHLVGNTVVDAVRKMHRDLRRDPEVPYALVTIHRRENWETAFGAICAELPGLAVANGWRVRFVLHPNPELQKRARRLLGSCTNIELLQPMGYRDFLDEVGSAAVILTDSGGIQEEAVALARPLVVLRDVTERPEGLERGVSVLAGTSGLGLVGTCDSALSQDRTSTRDTYGDGRAGERIAALLSRSVVS